MPDVSQTGYRHVPPGDVFRLSVLVLIIVLCCRFFVETVLDQNILMKHRWGLVWITSSFHSSVSIKDDTVLPDVVTAWI